MRVLEVVCLSYLFQHFVVIVHWLRCFHRIRYNRASLTVLCSTVPRLWIGRFFHRMSFCRVHSSVLGRYKLYSQGILKLSATYADLIFVVCQHFVMSWVVRFLLKIMPLISSFPPVQCTAWTFFPYMHGKSAHNVKYHDEKCNDLLVCCQFC